MKCLKSTGNFDAFHQALLNPALFQRAIPFTSFENGDPTGLNDHCMVQFSHPLPLLCWSVDDTQIGMESKLLSHKPSLDWTPLSWRVDRECLQYFMIIGWSTTALISCETWFNHSIGMEQYHYGHTAVCIYMYIYINKSTYLYIYGFI